MFDMTIQNMINTGMAWRLEGSIGRACMAAIEEGEAVLGHEGHRDYWGNYVPSRTEVRPGTFGSVRYANDIRAKFGLDRLTGKQYDRGLGFRQDPFDWADEDDEGEVDE
jgi:hypothetical protein